jgi:hypothetical protein
LPADGKAAGRAYRDVVCVESIDDGVEGGAVRGVDGAPLVRVREG